MENIKNSQWYQSVPKVSGDLLFEFAPDEKSYRAQFTDMCPKCFANYLGQLEKAGFASGENYNLDDNLYALRYGALATVYVSYSAKSREIALYAEERGHNNYPAPKQGGEEKYRPTLWQLETDCVGTKQNGGMSYVFLTADGSFVVIDGGYPTELEADNLYKHLKEKTPEGEKTVISAWFITHMHGDHYGALLKFAPKYASEIEVKGFYHHFDIMPDWFRQPFITAMSYWKDAKIYGRLHTGMQLAFSGITFDVIYTKEDYDPNDETYPLSERQNGNEHSTALRATINGQRLMLLADIQMVASGTMLRHHTDEILHADIVQFAHHGYEGGTPELYRAIGAHTVLWPMNFLSTQTSYGGIINVFKAWMNHAPTSRFPFGNSYVMADENVKKIIVEGEGLLEMQFPYTPEGPRMADIDAIYMRQNRAFLETYEWLRGVPRPDSAKEVLGYTPEEQSCIFEYRDITAADFDAYVSALSASGFGGGEDYELGANRYVLRENDTATVYAAYSANNSSLRLYASVKGWRTYPTKGEPTNASQYPVTMWQLPVDNFGSKENGGMSYVYLLGDGSFFVIDGGYPTELEADNLYKFLKEKTPAGKETVISMWFISHLHGDHLGALTKFAPKYAEDVKVESFLYHSRLPSGMKAATDHWPEAVHYAKPHTGMEWNFDGARVQILYTREDLLPASPETENDGSTVLRVTVNGQRLLFLGDIQRQASDCMEKYLDSEILRSELVQFAHHGYEGGTVSLYQKIDPHTVLWPMNIDGYQLTGYYVMGDDGHSLKDENGNRIPRIPQNVFGAWMNRVPNEKYSWPNRYVVDAENVKKIIVGGMGVFETQFPYTPTGEKLPDIDAVFEERKNIFLNQ
ncbi:MAG: MBL fold metallo-hydrolase [Ruminococcaceae bacterium]|nr:MBL fold metallo-hydrolase [Oscillospiraceae bacterium]